MSSLRLSMLFFSVSFKRMMFVILPQGPCSPVLVLTWRSSYADTVGEGVKKKNWQELRPMYRRDSSPEYSTRIPHVSPIPSYITARQQFPESCNSLLETAHTQKKDVSSQGPCCSKKKNTICALSVHAHASTQVSFMSSQATLHQGRVNLCTDEHQYSSSKASATD